VDWRVFDGATEGVFLFCERAGGLTEKTGCVVWVEGVEDDGMCEVSAEEL